MIFRLGVAGMLLLWTTPGPAAERSYAPDCLADRTVAWETLPPSAFGAAFLPGIVLGPPGDSSAIEGSFSVVSLGFGGSLTVAFDDIVIEDGPGPDFIVFENAFFRLPVPSGSSDDFLIFAEPGVVEVSADGESWTAFPFDAQALAASAGLDLDRQRYLGLTGLAGLTPTVGGNWTVPNDPAVFDPAGVGGVSGAGGDAFDLATVGLSEARFVRITDADVQNGFPGTSEGFDLDAVVVLNGRPRAPLAADTDGDRLSDAEELELHGTDPFSTDSDLDGVDDGREVAGCRDPNSGSAEPLLRREPRLWALGSACTELRWSFMGTGRLYDVVRAELASLSEAAGTVDLGLVDCLADDLSGLRWSCDGDTPPPSSGVAYLVRVDGTSDLGRSSNLAPRQGSSVCP